MRDDLEKEIWLTVQAFVAQITELTRRAGMEALKSAFDDAIPDSTAARFELSGRGGGDHPTRTRTSEDLEALSERLTALVQAIPGLRIEQINERLGTTTKDLVLPLRKLLAGGVIYSKGQTRSKAYFANFHDDDASLEPLPAPDARSQRVEHVVSKGVTEPAVGARVDGALPPNEFDTDWYRSLAGVFTFARRLQK